MTNSTAHENDTAAMTAAGLSSFDYQPQTRVIFGPGSVLQIGSVVKSLNVSRVLLVTDPGIKKAGHEDRVKELLESSGLTINLYDQVTPNPTTDDVHRGVEFARSFSPEVIIALGGGSSMDAGKGINFVLTSGGQMQDYKGIGKAKGPMLPFIAIPTTSGTGSEAQSFAVIADPRTHLKMACGDKRAMAKVAILDPELTVTMPQQVTIVTGIDAISHAVETYVTKKRNPLSQMFSRTAWRMLVTSFPKVLTNPTDVDARGQMLLGAHFAGLAIENSMLGATHAAANPLSAHYDMAHGIAIGLMLPYVVRHNQSAASSLYAELACDAGLCEICDPAASEKLASFLQSLAQQAGLPTTLRSANVDFSLLGQLASEASEQWTGTFNPRPMTVDDFQSLYVSAMG
ncbi:iron-containing alcohol dehydrogenase [Lacunimicrobium album]